MDQHPVFSRYQAFCGLVPAYKHPDFLGTMYSNEFVAGTAAPSREPSVLREPRYPNFDEEYFEWIAVLESALEARGSYVVMELGAGFGRWAVRAGAAIRQAHPGMFFRLFAVEAEPVVYQWMRQHFLDNGFDPDAHSLLHGAVTESPGDVLFYIGGPHGGPYDKKPDAWYGQFLTKQYDVQGGGMPDGEYAGFPVIVHESKWRSIRVPSVSLTSLLHGVEHVDLIDMDIEGQELPSIQANIDTLDHKVKRLQVGTHSAEIEIELRRLFFVHGWECRADYSLFSESTTPYGRIRFQNGVQSWINPRLG
jgi:FkbM family methyltransferase